MEMRCLPPPPPPPPPGPRSHNLRSDAISLRRTLGSTIRPLSPSRAGLHRPRRRWSQESRPNPIFNVLPRSPGGEALVVIPATRAIGAVAENVIRTLAQRDAVHERQAKVTIRLPQFWFEQSTNSPAATGVPVNGVDSAKARTAGRDDSRFFDPKSTSLQCHRAPRGVLVP